MVTSVYWNNLMRCDSAVHLLMRECEALELSCDEMETLKHIGMSIKEDIELITTSEQVVITN